MLGGDQERTATNLRVARNWKSFEDFRKAGAKALEPIQDGAIATLKTSTGDYRVMSEEDFQNLYGLACDVAHLQRGLSVVLTAARAVQKHNDPETIQVLIQTIKMMGNLSAFSKGEDYDFSETEASEDEIEQEDPLAQLRNSDFIGCFADDSDLAEKSEQLAWEILSKRETD